MIWRRNICGCSANGRWSGFSTIASARKAGNNPQQLAALNAKYPDRGNYVVMPLIPWDPYQSDFWYNEILPDIQARLNAGDRIGAEKLAREGRLTELADDIYNGSIFTILKDPKRSPRAICQGLARSGTMPSLAGLGEVPPTAPDLRSASIISARTAAGAMSRPGCSTDSVSRFSSRCS